MIKQYCYQKIKQVPQIYSTQGEFISHDESSSVNNILKEYDVIKQAIKSSNTFNSDNKYD